VTDVLAPCAGRLLPIAETPDPVFSAEMVGPGVAIDPAPGETTVVAPIAGKVVAMHPHAFVVLGGDGVGVLVHLGIDTVQLDGDGFTLLAAEGDEVLAGSPIVSWDPASVAARGFSPICPVIALDATDDLLADRFTAGAVDVGDPLFSWN